MVCLTSPTVSLLLSPSLSLDLSLCACSAILVWVGVWDFIVDYLRGGELGYDALYMSLGTVFLFLTRTLIAQAGLKPIDYAAHSAPQSFVTPLFTFLASTHHPADSSSAALYLRSLLALLAGIVFWLGAYNLLDLWMFHQSAVRDVLYTVAGLALMFATANVSSESTVIVDSAAGGGEATKSASTVVTSNAHFVFYHVKALVGLWGDVVYWVGTYNIADLWLWHYSPLRDSLYVVAGFFVFLAISIHVQRDRQRQALVAARAEQRTVGGAAALAGAGMIARAVEQQPLTASPPTVVPAKQTLYDRLSFYVRVIVTMVAGILFWVGWWNILSTYIYYGSEPSSDEFEPMGVPHSVGNGSSGFRLMSVVAQPLQLPSALGRRHRFLAMQRSSTSDTSFPMWILYLLYTAMGVVFLLISSTLTSSAGVIQPLATIREQTNMAIATYPNEAAEGEEEGQQFAVVEAPGTSAFVLDHEPNAY